MSETKEKIINMEDVKPKQRQNERSDVKHRISSNTLLHKEIPEIRKTNDYGVESDMDSVNRSVETTNMRPLVIKKFASERSCKAEEEGAVESDSSKDSKRDEESAINKEGFHKKTSELAENVNLGQSKSGKKKKAAVFTRRSKSKNLAHRAREENKSIEKTNKSNPKIPNKSKKDTRVGNMANFLKILSFLFSRSKESPPRSGRETPMEDTYECFDDEPSPTDGDRNLNEQVGQNKSQKFKSLNPFKRYPAEKFKPTPTISLQPPLIQPRRVQAPTSVLTSTGRLGKKESPSFKSVEPEPICGEYEYDELPAAHDDPPLVFSTADDDTYDNGILDIMTNARSVNQGSKSLNYSACNNHRIRSNNKEKDFYQNDDEIAMRNAYPQVILPPIPPKLMKTRVELKEAVDLPKRAVSNEKNKAKENKYSKKNPLLSSFKGGNKGPAKSPRTTASHGDEVCQNFGDSEEYEQLNEFEKQKEVSTIQQTTDFHEDEYELFEPKGFSTTIKPEHAFSRSVFDRKVSPEVKNNEQSNSIRYFPSLPKPDTDFDLKRPARSYKPKENQNSRGSASKTELLSKEQERFKSVKINSQYEENPEWSRAQCEKVDSKPPEKVPPKIPSRPLKIPDYVLSGKLSGNHGIRNESKVSSVPVNEEQFNESKPDAASKEEEEEVSLKSENTQTGKLSADHRIRNESTVSSVSINEEQLDELKPDSVSKEGKASLEPENMQTNFLETPISGRENLPSSCDNDVYSYLEDCY